MELTALAVEGKDATGTPVGGVVGRVTPDGQASSFTFITNGDDGYDILNIPIPFKGNVQVGGAARPFPKALSIEVTQPNTTLRFGGSKSGPQDIVLPAIVPFKRPLPEIGLLRGAFCIPNVLPGIPYGDGQRMYTPSFSCYRGTPWQDRMLAEARKRDHTAIEIQISGNPYGSDYPEIPLDAAGTVADLKKIRQAGFRTIVAFRDDVGTDCSYLQPIADATQDLVDYCMGIYESNGVFASNPGGFDAACYAKVESVLKQQRALWPKAVNCFHSTSQNNGMPGFGESDFWNRMAPEYVDMYLLQQSGWLQDVATVADRCSDFTERLIPGIKGWPKLKHGVCHFELSTSKTFRGWTEQQGIDLMVAVFGACRVKPTGYMDGGYPSLLT